MAYMAVKGNCKNCNAYFTGHPNKKFCKTKCKDRYHNRVNPRGFAAPVCEKVDVPKKVSKNDVFHRNFQRIEIAEGVFEDTYYDDFPEGWDGHK